MCVYVYGSFKGPSACGTLHTALNHVTLVWNGRVSGAIHHQSPRKTLSFQYCSHVRVIAECSVHSGLETLKRLYDAT